MVFFFNLTGFEVLEDFSGPLLILNHWGTEALERPLHDLADVHVFKTMDRGQDIKRPFLLLVRHVFPKNCLHCKVLTGFT